MDAYHSSYTRKLELTTTNYAIGAVSVYYHHASQPYIEDAARIPADGSRGLAGAHQHIGRYIQVGVLCREWHLHRRCMLHLQHREPAQGLK